MHRLLLCFPLLMGCAHAARTGNAQRFESALQSLLAKEQATQVTCRELTRREPSRPERMNVQLCDGTATTIATKDLEQLTTSDTLASDAGPVQFDSVTHPSEQETLYARTKTGELLRIEVVANPAGSVTERHVCDQHAPAMAWSEVVFLSAKPVRTVTLQYDEVRIEEVCDEPR